MNADRTIYGRYGTRSHETESDRDVALEGFAQALAAALKLHRRYREVKAALADKYGPEPAASVPEELPSLKEKYGSRIDYEGNVVQSCIHCHQVGEALRRVYRDRREPMPDKLLYPYPLPNVLGLVMDPKRCATVLHVESGSSAERDGFRVGDEIVTLSEQPIVSIADLQWVLHNAGDVERLTVEIVRGGKQQPLMLSLEKGWRRRGDISWRAGSWDLRRMTTGGMRLDDLSSQAQGRLGLDGNVLALGVRHVGQYGEHAAAKNAGFRKGDILVELDGSDARLTESQFMTTLVNSKRPGERVPVVVMRDGRRIQLQMPMQ